MNNTQQPERARDFLPRLRAFEVTFHPATMNLSDRVRIKDTTKGIARFLSYCYTTGSIIDQAYDHLTEQGLSIDHMVPLREGYLLITNDHETQLK